MISFSVAPSSKFHSASIERWRNDPELRSVMPMSRLGGTHVESAKLCFRFIRLCDLWLGVTATYSSLAYANVPTASPLDGERTFALLMPNKPRLLDVGGKRYWQKPGECVLTDSQASVVGTYSDPHAAICLNIPFDTVRAWLPDTHALEELRLGSAGTSSRVISLLLLALWRSVEAGGDDSDYRQAAESLLGLLETRCRRSAASGRAGGAHRGIDCELVRNFIDEHIRDPKLSVQTVAEKIGVTTRYLQLLFANVGDCVSEYIKRERLRGCLLDLRDAGFDQQSITDIAFSWGFNSAAHFSSSFRKEFSLSPRDYRNCAVEELPQSPLAGVEGPLVQALVALGRSVHGASQAPHTDARLERRAMI